MASSCCNLCCAAAKFACSDATLASACALAASAEWSWPNALASTMGTVTWAELRLRDLCHKNRLRVLEFGREVPRIELHQQRSRFDKPVVLHFWIDREDGSADARAHQIEMSFNLGVVCGFVISGAHPPKRSSSHGDRRDQ